MSPIIQLMQGDCLERMKEIPDESVDLVLCDLPYGVTHNKWDSVIPLDTLWNEYHRVAKPTTPIVLHCQQPFTTKLIASNMREFKYLWYWDKHTKNGFLNSKKQPLRQVEEIAVFYRKQCKFCPPLRRREKPCTVPAGRSGSSNYNGYGREGIVTIRDTYCATTLLQDYPRGSFVKGGHPTQKPVPLLEYLIQTYTEEGGVVLDNAMGSGSTGVACVNTGRSFIGIELDNHWFDMAQKRILRAQQDVEEKG